MPTLDAHRNVEALGARCEADCGSLLFDRRFEHCVAQWLIAAREPASAVRRACSGMRLVDGTALLLHGTLVLAAPRAAALTAGIAGMFHRPRGLAVAPPIIASLHPGGLRVRGLGDHDGGACENRRKRKSGHPLPHFPPSGEWGRNVSACAITTRLGQVGRSQAWARARPGPNSDGPRRVAFRERAKM